MAEDTVVATGAEAEQCAELRPSTESAKKRKVGCKMISNIKRLTCDGTQKIPVKCNRFGKGVNKKSSLLQSYIGFMARRLVSIKYKTWKKVPKNTKINLYNTIECLFDIPPTQTEKMVLRSASDKWRNFKCALGKLIVHEGVFRTEPPPRYSFIDQQSWEEFVQYRCTKEFQDLARKNAEYAKLNEYPYKQSRRSYARLEWKKLKKMVKDPRTSSIPRAEMWKLGRQDHKGDYDKEETYRMAEKIDMYTKQVAQGIIKLAPTEDVLTLALGKDEHYGRLRAVGFGVSKKKYFGASKPKDSASKQEVALRSELAELKAQMEAMQRQMNQQTSQTQAPQPVNDNYNSPLESDPHPVEEQLEILKRCTLFWPDKKHEVAKGRAFIPQAGYNSMFHCLQLDAGHVLKVILDTILPGCGAVSVPYAIDDVRCLSDAPGYIIGWPAPLVVIGPDPTHSSKGSRSSGFEPMEVDIETSLQAHQQSTLVQKCSSLLSKNKRFLLEIIMKKDIVQHSHTLFLGNDEVARCLKQKKLEAAHISFYIKKYCSTQR